MVDDHKKPNRTDAISKVGSSAADRVEQAKLANEQIARLPETKPVQSTPVTPATPQSQTPSRQTDQFQSVNLLAKFVTIVERRLEQMGLQVIRLPGRDRVVRDQRDGKEASGKGGAGGGFVEGGDAQGKSAKRAGMQGGKEAFLEQAGAKRPNYLGGFQGVVPPGQNAKAEDAKQQMLSAFETTLVGRFEGAEQQAKELPDGQFNFLKKTAGEWTGFFEKFLSRTFQKVVSWSDVQGVLFRGLLQEKGTPQKGILISDVMLANGTDKFARLSVQLPKLQQANLQIGTVIPKEMVQEAMTAEQMKYLALRPQQQSESADMNPQLRRGMFSTQQVEDRVAEHLGLSTDLRNELLSKNPLALAGGKSGGAKRRRSWFSGMSGDSLDDQSHRFVPWWSWDREERAGNRRWFVWVFGSVVFFVLAVLLIALIRGFHS